MIVPAASHIVKRLAPSRLDDFLEISLQERGLGMRLYEYRSSAAAWSCQSAA